MARVAVGNEELVAGQKYYVMMVVLPLGIPGNTRVQEAYGDVIADPGDTVDSVKMELFNHCIEDWEAKNEPAPSYSIYSFSLV